MKVTRRNALTAAGATIVTGAACGENETPPPAKSASWSPRVSENIGNLDEATLRWMAQLGLEWVVLQGTNEVDQGAKGFWSESDIQAVQARCQSFDLKLHSLMIPLGWLMNAMLGKPERDRDIENIRKSLAAAGAAGVTIIEWRWSPDFKWGADVGYYSEPGRGGATYKAFNYDSVRDAEPFPELGVISREELWDRMVYFAQNVMPAAEAAGVKMSLHPKDPPVSQMRGISRLLTNTDEIESFLDAVPSPANGFTFCQGTVTEMGVDVIDAIRRIGGRGKIHHIHFRGVRGSVPQYVETFIDEGDVDMLEAMRAYRDVGYSHAIVSDHTPGIPNELPGGKIGRSYSHGYIRGLVEAVNS